MTSLRHQLGSFSVPESVMLGDAAVGFAIMAQVIVVRCEHDFATGDFVYVAASEHFRALGANEAIPTYIARWEWRPKTSDVGIIWSEGVRTASCITA